jgi:hypothetical protein
MQSPEIARLPKRQTVHNYLPAGAKELLGLGKGISENKDTIYKREETKLFEVNRDIKTILEDMERKDDGETQ